MTEMEERLMTRFMQADGERNEANRELDAAGKWWSSHAARLMVERNEARAERGDHRAAARVLDAAGLWPHDLVDAHRRKAH